MIDIRKYRVLDAAYPGALRALKNPPDPLCVRGELPTRPGVAIVGTRQASRDALGFAHDLAFRLAQRGVVVWSGGALGIDRAAHEGALDAGGVTVAVLGTGFEFCYPPEHAPLYERIVLGGGALVSPFEVTQPPTLWTFLQRNGTLAALTEALILVQAPLKSGARSAAASARKLRRPLYVVPMAPWDPQGAGNLVELGGGARPLPNDDALMRLLGHPPPRFEDLSTTCQAVFEATRDTPVHFDDLCAKTGLTTPVLQEALLTLTLQAVLVEGPSGCYRRLNI